MEKFVRVRVDSRVQPVVLGGAVETDAYDHEAEYVIHAATMELGGGAREASIRDWTRKAVALADELGCESVVLPGLGCGAAGVDLERDASYIFEGLLAFDPAVLEDVRVIGYRHDAVETMHRVAREVRGRHRG